ncbi:MAG: hypothetical protein ABFD16_09605, partial [Thermoguttaceae bacterium]
MFDEPNNPNDATRDEIPSGDFAAGPGCERPVADAEGKEFAAEVPAGIPVAGDLAPDTAAAVPEHLDTAGSVEPTPAPAVTPVAKGAPKPTAGA